MRTDNSFQYRGNKHYFNYFNFEFLSYQSRNHHLLFNQPLLSRGFMCIIACNYFIAHRPLGA